MHSHALPYIKRRCTPIHCLILGDGPSHCLILGDGPSHCLILRDDALLHIDLYHLVVGIRGAQISITSLVLSASSP